MRRIETERKVQLERSTKETKVKVELNIDGSGISKIGTSISFFDHLLDQIAIHGSFDMKIIFDSASPEFEAEYTDDARRVLRYVLDFRVQTYLFKPIETSGVIGEIFINYYTNAQAFRRGIEAGGIAEVSNRITESTEEDRITEEGELRVTDYPYAPSGETTRLIGVSAWGTDDSYKIYDYEVYHFEDKIGETIRFGEPPSGSVAAGNYREHPTFVPKEIGEL